MVLLEIDEIARLIDAHAVVAELAAEESELVTVEENVESDAAPIEAAADADCWTFIIAAAADADADESMPMDMAPDMVEVAIICTLCAVDKKAGAEAAI